MNKDSPKLIVFSGLQGSGKSKLADTLSHELGIAVISVDTVESAIIRSGIGKTFETSLAAYLVAENIANEQLTLGNSIIIDAANYVRQAQEIWEKVAVNNNCQLKVIECICVDEDEHRARIENRVRNLHGLKEVSWSDVINRKAESETWDIEKLVVDTSTGVADNIDKMVEYIKS